MNLYGFATGTNDYSLNLSERDSLRPGDIVTVAFLNGNTGASTLSVNGNAPFPLLRNESAMSSGDLVALTLYQFCFTGAAFRQDVQASAGATTDASLLTSGTLAEARLPNNINATRVADGSISNTEFQYLNNVSSNIQGQLDALTTAINGEASTRAAADSGLTSSIAGKANTSHTHSGADITTGTVPVAAIPTAIPAASIANGTVDNTEFQTLNGVTSNIQNQLDNKLGLPGGTTSQILLGDGTPSGSLPFSATDSTKIPLSTGTTKGDIITYTASGTVTRRAVGSSGQFLTPNSGNSDGLEYRALTPSDMPAGATSAGTSHAGDATYRDQYSLAAGSHYGFLFVTDELGSASIFTISGTTITLYANLGANVWSAGGATDRKARISGGFVQVQCGATFGAGYVSTFFLGTVR